MERQRVIRKAKQEDEWEVRARQIEAEEQTIHHLKVEEAKRKKEKRMQEDKYLDNEELMRVKRMQKQAYEEEERARAREREMNTVKDMEMKEYDAEKKKRLLEDKYIDNRERERVIRQAKREEEWEQRAQAIERQEQTVHHLKVEEELRQREKRLLAAVAPRC